MSKPLFKNDDLILRDDAIAKLKTSDDLSRAAAKLKRAPQLDDVFLLHSGSRNLQEGKPSGNQRLSAIMFGFGLLGLFAMLALIGFALHSGVLAADGSFASSALLSLMAIMGGFFGWMTVIWLRQFYVDRDFDHNGVLLIGSLSSISGRWHERRRRPNTRHYRVTLDYEVELPGGTVISDTAEAWRPDLEALDARPKLGTPVVVRYSPKYKETRLL